MKNIILNLLGIVSVLSSPLLALAGESAAPTEVSCVGDSITYGYGIKD